MANKKEKKYYYVLVFTNEGPVYVTKVDNSTRMCYWDKDDKPYEFGSESYARETALGLSWNGNHSVPVVTTWEKDTQPYNYADYDIKFEKKEK